MILNRCRSTIMKKETDWSSYILDVFCQAERKKMAVNETQEICKTRWSHAAKSQSGGGGGDSILAFLNLSHAPFLNPKTIRQVGSLEFDSLLCLCRDS
eukprot:m.216876 g.216876  ORF g.216876 m.216876 type:complete len:98 (+) comp39879_c0_seq1:503-796(+)